jgi:uncharacterized membrane protein
MTVGKGLTVSVTSNVNRNDAAGKVGLWFNRRIAWLAKHWLWVANAFFFTYVGLPFLAPVLLAAGFTGAANTIYQMYNMVCHQLPTRTYFIFGQQVSMCERCISIYVTLFIGGVAFNFAHFKALSFQWYVLFALPMALDGGSAFVSELAQVLPLWIFWLMWSVIAVAGWSVLTWQKAMFWQMYLVFIGGFLALAYLQFVGLRLSDVYLRTLTGALFGLGTVWFAYPTLEEGFKDTWQETTAYLARVQQN